MNGAQPREINQHSPTEFQIAWNNGERYALSYLEARFHCPCAGCVNEHTGERTVQRATLPQDIRPTSVQLVGRYAIQISWSDRHDTGMYHYDRLFELCHKLGRKL